MSRPQKVLLWFLLWTAVGLFFSTQLILIDRYLYQRRASWTESVIGVLPKWYLWFLLTPVMLWMSRRFPIDRGRWVSRTAIHFLASAILSLLVVGGYALIAHYGNWDLDGARGYSGKFLFFLSVNYHWDMLTYGLVVAISQAAAYYRDLQERDARLAQAQLQALKSQLHPHFLFNALHATMALVRKDPPASCCAPHSITAAMSKCHCGRRSVSSNRTSTSRGRALPTVSPSNGTSMLRLSVRHGISPRATPGLIQVRAALENGRLKLEVQDNGVGSSASAVKEGIGLSNTRARLKPLYGERQKFELAAPAGGGCTVRMELPVLVAT
jgi:two-component system LytT family sensor kinase